MFVLSPKFRMCVMIMFVCLPPCFNKRTPNVIPNSRCRCFTHRRPNANSRVSWNFSPPSTFSNLTPKNRTRQQEAGPLTRLLERTERAVTRRAQASRIERQQTRLCAKKTTPWRSCRSGAASQRLRPPPMTPERQVSLFSGGWVTFHGAL